MNNALLRGMVLVGAVSALTGCFDNDDDKPEVNVAPVAEDAMFTTQADIAFAEMLSASDANGDALTYTLATDSANGTTTVTEDGDFTYTPNAQFTGTDTFVFSVTDGVNDADMGEVTITIEAQQVSFSSYTRDAFNQEATDEPLPINGRAFTQDAEESSFDDLLPQQ
ncbi:Ig-like domain-containing protein [Alteromonas stellipolaris]|uniref:Ig-like domain-containing protein n=1 Tax=Alteromonas stellipolaris TaxID=233316 RepID=UPI002736E957|nr:Ig-like domain-containing protein [Alteromonas stellipolaris]MDP2535877.1 Ig-like domain-containing protein [Alteromonas stellipolaris]